MANYNFIPWDREQVFLLPPSLRDWLPAGDLAWFVIDVVKHMNLKPFRAKYRADGWGRAAFDPTLMVGLLVYAYSVGERSSRRIERLCERDAAFRVVAANLVPDHTTIARFRQENEAELEGLFTEVLKLCKKAGLLKVGLLALDGTKMEANASLDANRTHEHLDKEVKRLLAEAKAKDAEEDKLYGKDKRGDELPEDLRDPKSRFARLKECKERLEREAAEVAAKQAEKIATRQAEEAATGKKKRGRKPKAPDPTPTEEAKANVTDPESRIMKTRSGYVQGYNAQAVATKDQIVVACDLTQEANDVKQLVPMLAVTKGNLVAVAAAEPVEIVLGDAGYWSESNVTTVEADPESPELLLATNKDWKQRKAARERPYPRGRIPKNLSSRDRMERKLLTKRGRTFYKKRSQIIEPVFGQTKSNRSCVRFMRRGKVACKSEWSLINSTGNVVKIWRSGRLNFNLN